jgi:hypothetical protein
LQSFILYTVQWRLPGSERRHLTFEEAYVDDTVWHIKRGRGKYLTFKRYGSFLDYRPSVNACPVGTGESNGDTAGIARS